MIAIQFKTILAVCAFAGCIAISPSSHAQYLVGDVNLDGTLNMSDVLPFREVLIDAAYQFEADIDFSGTIDFRDIAGFAQILADQAGVGFENTATDGGGDFFWSTLNVNEGAVNGPIDLSLTPGESVTLYLYYSFNGPSNSEIMRGYSINVVRNISERHHSIY